MPLIMVWAMAIMGSAQQAARFTMPTDLVLLTDHSRSALGYKFLIQAMVERSLYVLTTEAPMSTQEILISVTEPSLPLGPHLKA